MEIDPLTVPSAPDYRVPWEELQVFSSIRDLEDCPQDPIHHAEGNVWIHTRMVLATLVAMPSWRQLPEIERRAVYLASLLHDIGKPATTRIESDGRVTSKGHSFRGEIMARALLWERGYPFHLRELICGLVKFHQMPFYLIDCDDAQKRAAEISLVARCDLLAIVAEADIRGRICADLPKILDNIELYREFCREEDCYTTPRSFPTPHTRFTFFRSEGRNPDVTAYDDTKVEVVVLSGLPGSGKSTYVRKRYADWPVVSLDGLREELDIDPRDNQGPVVQAARERAREYLRSGQPFVWDATNISKRFRTPLLSLLADYHARIKVVYVEASSADLWSQNRSRADAVPEKAIRGMMDRWELPDLTEAHEIVYTTQP